ncbi:hypothetical protein PG994_008748 [Apiospora phragmitis]|uniref:Uncharacterized protein n=1 Tax=Apiospora phragmitis TaxID=2905665 RepID=A0ABR1UHB7_9PEZI
MSPCPFLASTGSESYNTQDGKPQVSARDEFARIEKAYPSLASTGCNAEFCQAGRMKHTDEERVGRNQRVDGVKHDATDFLYQLRKGGISKMSTTSISAWQKSNRKLSSTRLQPDTLLAMAAGPKLQERNALELSGKLDPDR